MVAGKLTNDSCGWSPSPSAARAGGGGRHSSGARQGAPVHRRRGRNPLRVCRRRGRAILLASTVATRPAGLPGRRRRLFCCCRTVPLSGPSSSAWSSASSTASASPSPRVRSFLCRRRWSALDALLELRQGLLRGLRPGTAVARLGGPGLREPALRPRLVDVGPPPPAADRRHLHAETGQFRLMSGQGRRQRE